MMTNVYLWPYLMRFEIIQNIFIMTEVMAFYKKSVDLLRLRIN